MRPPTTAELALPPSRRVAQLAPVACVEVLRGSRDDTVVLWLGGRSAAEWRHEPWPVVWALRALLYVWDGTGETEVMACLGHDGWRVREMAAKVVLKRELPAGDLLAPLARDEVPRVQVAALRALGAVGDSEHADAVRYALADGVGEVLRAAAGALSRMEDRLDRPLR
jgi:HEAT repeat protein